MVLRSKNWKKHTFRSIFDHRIGFLVKKYVEAYQTKKFRPLGVRFLRTGFDHGVQSFFRFYLDFSDFFDFRPYPGLSRYRFFELYISRASFWRAVYFAYDYREISWKIIKIAKNIVEISWKYRKISWNYCENLSRFTPHKLSTHVKFHIFRIFGRKWRARCTLIIDYSS